MVQAGVVGQLPALSSPVLCNAGGLQVVPHTYTSVVSALGSLFLKNAKNLELFGQKLLARRDSCCEFLVFLTPVLKPLWYRTPS